MWLETASEKKNIAKWTLWRSIIQNMSTYLNYLNRSSFGKSNFWYKLFLFNKKIISKNSFIPLLLRLTIQLNVLAISTNEPLIMKYYDEIP